VDDEVGEEGAALPPGELVLESSPFEVDDEAAAKLDARRRARQGFTKVPPSRRADNDGRQRRGGVMARLINCECGAVVRGETDDELVANAEAHIGRHHPDLVGKLSREDILGMSEEA
jgi:hypothetical protein